MLLTVTIMAAILISVTAIAGFLTLNQLRVAVGASDSQRAIYAADTGVEWELYKHFRCASATSTPSRCADPPPEFANGEVFVTSLSPDGESAKSTGYADDRRRIARAFQLLFAVFE